MKQTIKVLDEVGNALEVEGTPVVVPGHEQHDFIFCKHKHMKGYAIRELSTGMVVYPYYENCKNKAQAINTAQVYLDKYHIGTRYKDKMQEYLDRCNDGKPLNKPFIGKKIKIKQSTITGE